MKHRDKDVSKVAVLALSLICWAFVFKIAEAKDDDEVDFSWLDQDKRIYVLQNRKYRNDQRFGLYASGAMTLNDPFRNGYGGIVRASYSFTDQLGLETFFGFFGHVDSTTLSAVKSRSSTLPYVREVRSYFAGVGSWTPFYGKFNFFNKIIYFDWFFNAGIGYIQTANDINTVSGASPQWNKDNRFGIFFGTGQKYFLNKNLLIRWDILGMNYGATGADGGSRRFTQADFAIGLGYLF